MVVKVEQIAEEGLQLNESIGLELLTSMLSEDGDTGFRPIRPSRLNATLRKMRDGVLVRGQFTVHLMNRASREQDEESGGEKDDGLVSAGSFGLEDADQDWFNGKTIDFDPILREQLLLALPMHVVCREECKGLCSVCGQDLNVKSCGCEQKVVDPRLAKLKYIKLN